MLIDEIRDAIIKLNAVMAKISRKWLGRSTLIDAIEDVFSISVTSSVTAFSQRYGVNEEYRLPSSVKSDYEECIAISSSAFVKSLFGDDLDINDIDAITEYLTSEIVSYELSKLLEPGVEEFDLRALTIGFFHNVDDTHSKSISKEDVGNAWLAFQKAFSFASRARPDLREFIRASYEEGSFNALTDIKDIVDRMKHDGDNLLAEEDRLDTSMKEYKSELADYKEWAKRFGTEKTTEH
ncbi:MAG: hypothetical protein AAFY76_13400 [Cyanobacteria bacterium J06649_11]